MNIKKYFGYLSIVFIFLFTSSAQAKTTIDVLALYSPAVTTTYGSQADAETTIQHMINVANGVYSDSPPNDIELRLVHSQETALLDDNATSLSVLENGVNNPTFRALRDQYGADIVVMFRPTIQTGGGLTTCGIAYVLGLSNPGFSEFAYGNVSLGGVCPTSTTVHEIGHTLGLSHSHLQDDPRGGATRLPYALGHGVNGRFATIMAYDFLFNTNKTVYKHSSPDLDCGNGLPCGVPVGQQGEAHAVLALNEFAPNVANYRESKNTGGDDNTDGGTDGGDSGTDGGTDGGTDTGETELEQAEREFNEAKAAFLSIRDVFIEKRNDFVTKRNAFRAAVANFRNVRNAFRNGQATRAEAIAARDVAIAARDEARAARADVIAYRNDTFRPARQALIDARNRYRELLAAS